MLYELYKLNIDLARDIPWTLRPVTNEIISAAAIKVVFLIEMQHTLIHDYMLMGFYQKSRAQMCELSRMYELPYKSRPVHQNGTEDVEFENVRIDLKKFAM